MTIIAQDTFNGRTNASAFGLASDGINTWTAYQTASGFSVSGNEGIVKNTAGGAAQYNHYHLGSGLSIPQDLALRFTLGTSGDGIGLEARQKDQNNWYMLRASGGQLALVLCNAGTNTTLTSISQTFTPGTYYWLHLRVYANQITGRAWIDGSTEPSNWMLTATDSTIATAGTAGLYLAPTSTTVGIQVDSFTFQDSFQSGGPINASDYNSGIIYALQPPAGAQEVGKYALYGSAYVSAGNINIAVAYRGKQSTAVSIAIDTADQAAVRLSPTTPNTNPAAASLTGAFQIYSSSTAITTSAYCAGNWTLQF